MFASRYFTSRYFSPRYFTSRTFTEATLINKWLGVAQSLAERRVMIPVNVFPGSMWQLRVGSRTYTYTYPDTIEIASLSENERARTVVEGIISAYESSGRNLGGGTDGASLTLSIELYDGKWGIEAKGAEDGTPLDLELTASDPTRARVSVVQLQAGRAAQNETKRVRWPQRPNTGNLKLRYEDAEATVAYNASASAVQSALAGLSSIGSGNVQVRGDYQSYYDITFQGALAAKPAGQLSAWSLNATGVAAVSTEVMTSAQQPRATYILSKLDGNSNSLYQFSYNEELGHYFTGAATAEEIRTAAESVPGIGNPNVEVVPLEDGSHRIALIGEFVGTSSAVLGVEPAEGSSQTAVTLAVETTPAFGERKSKIRYVIHNLPDSGTFTFDAGGASTSAISWPPTAGTINSVLSGISTGFTCISVSDGLYQAMEIILESVLPTRDIDLIIPQLNVSGLIGTRAMDVRVVASARSPRNEVQQITIATDPVGGTFTLTFGGQTTSALAYNSTASDIQTALIALSSVGSGGCRVSGQAGGPWLVEFIGSLAASDQPLTTGNASGLTLSATATVSTVQVAIPTGPNWWTNDENWSLGHVPTEGEIATFEGSSVPCRYGIDGVPAFGALDIYRSYTGAGIGLSPIRADGSPETLPSALRLSDNNGDFRLRIGIGDDGAGPSLVRVDGDEQRITASVFYTQSSVGDGTYAVMLSGLIDELHIGDAIVGVGVTAGSAGEISKLRMRQRANQSGSVVEWGERVTANDVEVQAGTLRAGTPPKSLFMIGGDAIVRGIGDMDSMVVRASTIRWLAKGELGKQGLISALGVDGNGQAVLTSNAHGLVNGSRVFISGIKGIRGIPDGYYGVSGVTSNTFTLAGTAPQKPYGASSPSAVGDYYEANTARWGLADAIVIGAGATIDMSEQAELRTLGAPIVIQADDAVLNDPLVTIPDLRMRFDPGVQEATLGTRCVVRRDERAAASASAGYAGGAGGFVVTETP